MNQKSTNKALDEEARDSLDAEELIKKIYVVCIRSVLQKR